jgi:hypothetical protein
MRDFCKWMEDQPRILRIILCIFVLDISWAVYRIGRAVTNKNWFHMVLGIIWVFVGGSVAWILDLIWMILFDHIFWFEND